MICGHTDLNRARLPIPPHPQIYFSELFLSQLTIFIIHTLGWLVNPFFKKVFCAALKRRKSLISLLHHQTIEFFNRCAELLLTLDFNQIERVVTVVLISVNIYIIGAIIRLQCNVFLSVQIEYTCNVSLHYCTVIKFQCDEIIFSFFFQQLFVLIFRHFATLLTFNINVISRSTFLPER